MRLAIILTAVALAALAGSAIADPPAEASAASSGYGSCDDPSGGYAANDANGDAQPAAEHADVTASTYCDAYSSSGYTFHDSSLHVELVLHEDATGNDAGAVYDWSASDWSDDTTGASEHSCTSSIGVSTEVRGAAVPIGCPFGAPPHVQALLP